MNLYRTAQENLQAGDMQGLKTDLHHAGTDELRGLVESLTPEERVVAFCLLTKERALTLFEQIDVEQRENLITSFSEEEAIGVFAAPASDDRARLLDEAPAAVAGPLLPQDLILSRPVSLLRPGVFAPRVLAVAGRSESRSSRAWPWDGLGAGEDAAGSAALSRRVVSWRLWPPRTA